MKIETLTKALLEFMPKHECSFWLQHNPNRDIRETVEDWAHTNEYEWRSDEEKARAIATNEIWTMSWYPRTPISCYDIAAPTLEALFRYAEEVKKESEQ